MAQTFIGIMVKIIINILIIVSLHANPFFFGQQTPDLPASASDNFDSYSDGALLEEQANWAGLVASSIVIVKPTTDGAIRGNNAGYNNVVYRTNPTFSANHESEITLIGIPNAIGGSIGIAVRCQVGELTCYETHWDELGATVYLAVISGGSWSLIDTVSKVYINGNKLRLEVSGVGAATRLTVKEDTGSGWVAIISAADPETYIDGGQPGVYGYTHDEELFGTNWAASDL